MNRVQRPLVLIPYDIQEDISVLPIQFIITHSEKGYLEVVEDEIGIRILSWNHSHPQLPHEEHLIADWNHRVFLICMVVLNPVGKLTHEVKEKFVLRNGED